MESLNFKWNDYIRKSITKWRSNNLKILINNNQPKRNKANPTHTCLNTRSPPSYPYQKISTSNNSRFTAVREENARSNLQTTNQIKY